MSKPAVRRNINDLLNEPEELLRFVRAFSSLKDNDEDWRCICAIHGGGFPQNSSIEEAITPYVKLYNQAFGVGHDQMEKLDPDWHKAAFCAHGIPLFFIWHRPYMRCFELLLQKHDDTPNKEENPLGMPYWAWDQETATPHGMSCSHFLFRLCLVLMHETGLSIVVVRRWSPSVVDTGYNCRSAEPFHQRTTSPRKRQHG